MAYPLRQPRSIACLVALYLIFGAFIAPVVSGCLARLGTSDTTAASSSSLAAPDDDEESASAKAVVRKEGIRLEVRPTVADFLHCFSHRNSAFDTAPNLPRFWGLDCAPRGPPTETASLRAPPRFS